MSRDNQYAPSTSIMEYFFYGRISRGIESFSLNNFITIIVDSEKLLSNTYNRVVTARAFIVGCMNLQCRAVILYFIGTIKGTTSKRGNIEIIFNLKVMNWLNICRFLSKEGQHTFKWGIAFLCIQANILCFNFQSKPQMNVSQELMMTVSW